jgi:dipeptide/tripeptide permease
LSTPDTTAADDLRDDYRDFPARTTGHPTGFWFFFWGEFAERCSYYGMRAILPLYMTAQLKVPDADAASWYSTFKMACYFLPLLGGYLADRFFGKYWTIVGFSVPYVLGQLLIGFEDQTMLVLALALCAMGSGVIKPNISSLMGLTYDQQRPGNVPLRANAFLWFYFSINVGSTISMLALPVVRNKYGYQVAFLFPAALMALALAVFAAGKRFFATETVGPRPLTPEESEQRQELMTQYGWFLGLLVFTWLRFVTLARSVGHLFGIFALLVFFWVVYEHNDNLWVFFARDRMDLTPPSWVPEWFTREVEVNGAKQQELAPDQFQFINAALILILVPLSTWFWPRVDPTGKRFPHTTKMLIGFLFTAAAPAAMAAAGYLAAGGAKVSTGWMVLAYFLLTVGEVLVYGTGLDLSYAYAPDRLKGFVTACFLVTNALGNLINTQFTKFYENFPDWWRWLGRHLWEGWPWSSQPLSPGGYFVVDTGIALAAAVAFYFVGRKFTRSSTMAA